MVSNLTTSSVLKNLRGELTPSVPIWLMRQAGRYLPEYRSIRQKADSFLDLCYSPKKAAEITLQPVRRFGFDAAIIFSDILVIPDALGQKLSFEEGKGPILEPIDPQNSIGENALDYLRQTQFMKMGSVYEAINIVKTAKPRDCALIGFAGGAWTVATYMVEGGSSRTFESVRKWAYSDDKSFSSLINILTEATILHLNAQVDAGAEILQIFESHAGILDCYGFDKWIIQPFRKIISSVKSQHPEIPIIGFPRGGAANILKFISETGVDAISLDQSIPPCWAASKIQPKIPVQGNLDPIHLVSDAKKLSFHANEILNALSGGPFVFNLGHGVDKNTKPETVERLVQIVRKYKRV